MYEIESEELQTKPDCRDVAVQITPHCQEVAVQTHTTAVETTGRPNMRRWHLCINMSESTTLPRATKSGLGTRLVLTKKQLLLTFFRLHSRSGSDTRKAVHSSESRRLAWVERVWTEASCSWRQPSSWHERVQNQHQSKSLWTVSVSWGFRPPQSCLLDLSTLQVCRTSNAGNTTLCIPRRWGGTVL